MSTQQIVERILSDATAEAQAIVEEAESKAASILADASIRAEQLQKTAEVEALAKRKSILEKRAADARLDGSKLMLSEKRKVINAVYDEALSRLLEISKEDCLRLVERLLTEYAEEGDEIVLAQNFAYRAELEILPIVAKKGLRICEQREKMDGGLRLKGVSSDKDLSYGALLNADREANQAALAKELFK